MRKLIQYSDRITSKEGASWGTYAYMGW